MIFTCTFKVPHHNPQLQINDELRLTGSILCIKIAKVDSIPMPLQVCIYDLTFFAF